MPHIPLGCLRFLLLVLVPVAVAVAAALPPPSVSLTSSCSYDSKDAAGTSPSSTLPWAVTIRPSKRATFAGAILNERTIITGAETFRSQTPGSAFFIHPFANYTVIVNGAQGAASDSPHVQRLSVSYIKPHPRLKYEKGKWATVSNEFVLVYLAEPIIFRRGVPGVPDVGPLCLPNTTFMNQIYRLDNRTAITLADVIVGGLTKTTSTLQTSYGVRLSSWAVCHQIWDSDPATKPCGCNYLGRGCGNISVSAENDVCVLDGRDSGVVLPGVDSDNKHMLLGFLNFYSQKQGKCPAAGQSAQPPTLVYVSLLFPGVLEWIERDLRCGPDRFACNNGRGCVDLSHVCSNGTRGPPACSDGSDQNSNYCDALLGCEPHQFRCSTGLASYCIPAVNATTGKEAVDCDGHRDCPGGEDEHPQLCDENTSRPVLTVKPPVLAAAAGSSAVALGLLAIGAVTFIFVQRARQKRWKQLQELRDMTDEELIQFFEGERHLHGVYINVGERIGDGDSSNTTEMTTTTESDATSQSAASSSASASVNEELLPEFYPETITHRGYDDAHAHAVGLSFDVTDRNQCTLGEKVGTGAFGVVHRGTVHGRSAAIKYPNFDVDIGSFKVLLLELKILRYIHEASDGPHSNVVRFIGADTSRIRSRILYVALEYYENGSMSDYIAERRNGFKTDICGALPTQVFRHNPSTPGYAQVEVKEPHLELPYRRGCVSLLLLVRWASEIASGMEFLSHRIRHLDLAARNVLLDAGLVAKVGDFSLSRRAYENIQYKLKRRDVLPFRYLPLELLLYGRVEAKSDVWSYGVVLWELFSLCELPWSGVREEANDVRNFIKNLEAGDRLPKPKYASPELYTVMGECWNPDSDRRPDFGTLEQFFRDVHENLL